MPVPIAPVVLRATPPADACCSPGPGLIPRDEAERAASAFKALGDPVRITLLRHIADAEHGTACACHLPDALGISQPTLSHHLRKLADAGLIVREQRGRWAHYTIQRDALDQLAAFIDAARGTRT